MADSTPSADQPVHRPPGTVVPWEDKKSELGEIQGDEALVRRVWEETDGWTYAFVWQCLLSF